MRAVLQLLARFRRIDDVGWHRQAAARTIPVGQRDHGQRIALLQPVVPIRHVGRQLPADLRNGFLQLREWHLGVRRLLLLLGKV